MLVFAKILNLFSINSIFLINLCFVFDISASYSYKPNGNGTTIYSGMDGAMRYLSEFGYMDEKIDKPHMTMADMKDSIMDFQEMCSLKQTGELDSATIRMMNMPRCANRDHVDHPHRIRSKKRRQFHSDAKSKRYVLHGAKWEKSVLTYRVQQYTRQPIIPHQVDQVITRAFGIWEKEINLRFVRAAASASEVDIEIRFVSGPHGDTYPFTGDFAYTLAHGFYPGTGLGGDIHFNEAINWTIGYNLLYTAVHEIGHALGLRHSTDQAAVMFAHYLNEGDVKLHYDDIAGITQIYGRRQTHTRLLPPEIPQPPPRLPMPPPRQPLPPPQFPPRVTPNPNPTWHWHHVHLQTTPPPPVTPRVQDNNARDESAFLARRQSEFCRSGKVDAIVTLANGEIYFFRGDEILPLKFSNGKYTPGPILRVNEIFGGKLPPSIDAAFTREDGKTYFFKGDVYWRSTNNQIEPNYPKRISSEFPGIPNDLDSAFIWSNNQIYFFKGTRYWKFNANSSPPVSSEYPMEMDRPRNWEGVPGDIDAVFRSPQGITYFFKTGRYWRFDDHTGAVAIPRDVSDSPYPRDARVWWFLCTEFKPMTNL